MNPRRVLLLTLLLVLGWTLPAFPQGQMINGDRTVTGGFNAGTATGAVNTYALTLAPALPAYVDRQCFVFKANLANTGVATLNVNGLGAKTLKKRVGGAATDLAANDIGLGQYVQACYDGTVMQAQPLGGGTGGGGGTGDAIIANSLQQFPASSTTSAQLATILTDEVGASGGFVRAGGNVATATALAADPVACSAGQFVTDIAATGTLTCSTPAGGGNVSSTGSPTAGLTAEWTSATVIAGIGNTGTGLYVKQTSPALITPALGVATATSLNKVLLTAPATSATLTIADGKTVTQSNTVTYTATDGSTVAFGTGGTVAYTTGNIATATALAANPTPCTAGQFVTDIAANGTLTCATPPGAPVKVIFDSSKSVTNSTLTSVLSLTVATSSSVGAEIAYGVTVKDAGNQEQIEIGHVTCRLTDIGGVRTNNSCLKSANDQAVTSGTLSVTWSLTAANPALLQVTVVSSLSPSATFPLVSMPLITNLTNQAMVTVP